MVIKNNYTEFMILKKKWLLTTYVVVVVLRKTLVREDIFRIYDFKKHQVRTEWKYHLRFDFQVQISTTRSEILGYTLSIIC